MKRFFILVAIALFVPVYADRQSQMKSILEQLGESSAGLVLQEQVSGSGVPYTLVSTNNVNGRFFEGETYPRLITWSSRKSDVSNNKNFTGENAFATEADVVLAAKKILDAAAPGYAYHEVSVSRFDEKKVEDPLTHRSSFKIVFDVTVNGFSSNGFGNFAVVSIDAQSGLPLSIQIREGFRYEDPEIRITQNEALSLVASALKTQPTIDRILLRYLPATMFDNNADVKMCVLAYDFYLVDGSAIAVSAKDGEVSEHLIFADLGSGQDASLNGKATELKKNPPYKAFLIGGLSMAFVAMVLAGMLRMKG